jgi:hypothetical protein
MEASLVDDGHSTIQVLKNWYGSADTSHTIIKHYCTKLQDLQLDKNTSTSFINEFIICCHKLEKRNQGDIVGRTSFLHSYYLAFVVLTYLAYLIAVNTSFISSLGTTYPGIQALIALDWLFGESQKRSLSPDIHQ